MGHACGDIWVSLYLGLRTNERVQPQDYSKSSIQKMDVTVPPSSELALFHFAEFPAKDTVSVLS